jgi:multiple RNA-binding domain-containing protein 1
MEDDTDTEDEEDDSEDSDDAEDPEDEAGKVDAGGTPSDGRPKIEEVTADDMEAVAETGRVFVRNLSFTATEEEVAAHFASFGALTAVHIIVDRSTRRSKGLAYITYALPENGMKAMDELDGTIFQGRLIHLLPAKRPPNADATLGGVGRTGAAADGDGSDLADDTKGPHTEAEREAGFKASRDARLKADAGTNRAAWNTLFMRQDTVAAAVAAKYGVSKADLLESDAGDVAVRMALGEAQVIAETKEQLSRAGVDPATLEAAAAAGGANVGKGRPGVKRSTTAIMLKNLPYESEEEDLRLLCERFGGVARLVLPDTHTLAVVEWLEAADARKAFKGLAYKRYKHVPIYVEWAPEGVFTEDAPAAGARATSKGAGAGNAGGGGAGVTPRVDGGGRGAAAAAAREAVAAAATGADADGTGTGDEEATQLFVKGLSFQTSEAGLRAHFLRAASAAGGRVLSASVATQRGPGGAALSRGFGFVEFDSAAAARSVRRAMQGKDLDGRALKLEASSQGGGGGVGGVGGDDSGDKTKVPKGFSATKIVVRNVAFEATKRDIQKLFNPFGTLKSCRLPKKFDGNHRGFAFAELATKREATAALEALRGTHLYGRRLTIERAEEGDDVAALREKTAAHFDAGSAGASAAAGEPIAKRRKQQR